ncbi:hypothetical protein P5V15_004918 [Pogonomyrmex californicus]
MAPTICIAEFPMAGTTVSTNIHRRRRSQNGTKRRRFALEEMLRTGTIVETFLPSRENCSRRLDCADAVSDCSIADKSGRCSTNMDEHYRRLVAERRKDLLSIVIRTIILVRRNCILQRRLNALRAETRRFLRSVLNNPENQRQQRSPQTPSNSEDSSFAEKIVTTFVTSPLNLNSTRSSFHRVTSIRDNHDYINEESSSSDKSEDSCSGEKC